MKERPILFSGEMVQAILDGRKTQTRRVVKHKSGMPHGLNAARNILRETMPGMFRLTDLWEFGVASNGRFGMERVKACPYGKPGDRIWVRESWSPAEPGPIREGMAIAYKQDFAGVNDGVIRRWKSPIHMFRWMSRITLEITTIGCERLQDISETDARAEGVCTLVDFPDRYRLYGEAADSITPWTWDARESFRTLWGSINGWGQWGANPWVWAISFRRINGC